MAVLPTKQRLPALLVIIHIMTVGIPKKIIFSIMLNPQNILHGSASAI